MDYEVSIVITCNDDTYIKRGLNSLLRQSIKNIQIIIAQENENEKLVDILNEYIQKNKNIEIINNICANEKELLKYTLPLVKSKYVYFCMNNDVLAPNAIEQLYKCAKQTNSSFVYSDIAILQPNNQFEIEKDILIDNNKKEYKLSCEEKYQSIILHPYLYLKLIKTSNLIREFNNCRKYISTTNFLINYLDNAESCYKLNQILVYLDKKKESYIPLLFNSSGLDKINYYNDIAIKLNVKKANQASLIIFKENIVPLFEKISQRGNLEEKLVLNKYIKDYLVSLENNCLQKYVGTLLRVNVEMYMNLPFELYQQYISNQPVTETTIIQKSNIKVPDYTVDFQNILKQVNQIQQVVSNDILKYENIIQGNIDIYNPAFSVIKKFRDGELGFKTIINCFKAWIKFKLKKNK